MAQILPDAGDTVALFAAATGALDARCPARAALAGAGPVVVVEAPGGGPAYVVRDVELARTVLVDPRIGKDPALAPPTWDRWTAGLEPTAAEQPSLTTLDGPAHTALRRAHSPLLSARRTAGFEPRIRRIAHDLLAAADPVVDLTADLTTRYPLTVLCDLLGVPLDEIDRAADACRGILTGDPAATGRAMGTYAELAASALAEGRTGLAAELRRTVPEGTSPETLRYLIFTLLFAGQLTTEAAAGFLLADALSGSYDDIPADDLVRDVLRRHPPAPFSLWRFAIEEIALGDVTLPAGGPVLVDIEGVNAGGADLSFGAGPHYCTGAHLAQLELRVLVEVLREDFPDARLDVPFADLRQARPAGTTGGRLTALPVRLGGPA